MYKRFFITMITKAHKSFKSSIPNKYTINENKIESCILFGHLVCVNSQIIMKTEASAHKNILIKYMQYPPF